MEININKKKIITILTATRAEYGLLRLIIKKLVDMNIFEVRVVATGMHLSEEFGYTYQEIEEDGFTIHKKIDVLSKDSSAHGISATMSNIFLKFSTYFKEYPTDMLLLLGDRYETFAVAGVATNYQIPIAHLYGGETTEGAVDEALRHAITKMSYLHFTSSEEYTKRVIQLGEAPNRVFTVGATGIENILTMPLLSEQEIRKYLGIESGVMYAMVTFHPVTLENRTIKEQFMAVKSVCQEEKDTIFIVTKSNADVNGSLINQWIDEMEEEEENIKTFTSLGSLRYLSALKYCAYVLGNSSSGLIEAPSFHVPTINIGNRQKGRLSSKTTLHCQAEKNEILTAIRKAKSIEFLKEIENATNPYGDGNSSYKIVTILKEYMTENKIDLRKSFYDLKMEE